MLKGIVNCFLEKQTNKKFQSYNNKKKFWQHISVKIEQCAKSGSMITRSCCSSRTRSIILRSMQDLRSNPQGAGNPNIPWSCTALLQNSQSAAPGASVYHTHASPSLSKRCERFRRVPGEWGGGGSCCHFLRGKPDTLTQQKTQGHNAESERGSTTAVKKIKSSQTKRGQLGKTKKIDWRRKLSWKSQWKCNLDFHFKRFEVSGTHLFICTPVWPRQTEIILKLNIRRNSHFLYLLVEIPVKRGSCLLVSYCIFFFSPG